MGLLSLVLRFVVFGGIVAWFCCILGVLSTVLGFDFVVFWVCYLLCLSGSCLFSGLGVAVFPRVFWFGVVVSQFVV